MGLRARRSVVVDGLGWPSYATTGRVRRILTADIALSSCSVLSYVIESQAGISSKPTTHRQPIEGSQRPPVVAVPRHGIFQLIACRKMGDTRGSGEPVPVSDLEVSPLSFRARTAIRRGVSRHSGGRVAPLRIARCGRFGPSFEFLGTGCVLIPSNQSLGKLFNRSASGGWDSRPESVDRHDAGVQDRLAPPQQCRHEWKDRTKQAEKRKRVGSEV